MFCIIIIIFTDKYVPVFNIIYNLCLSHIRFNVSNYYCTHDDDGRFEVQHVPILHWYNNNGSTSIIC